MSEVAAGLRTPTQFIAEVEKIVKDKNMTYLDACLEYARTANVELETIASLMLVAKQFEVSQPTLLKDSFAFSTLTSATPDIIKPSI